MICKRRPTCKASVYVQYSTTGTSNQSPGHPTDKELFMLMSLNQYLRLSVRYSLDVQDFGLS